MALTGDVTRPGRGASGTAPVFSSLRSRCLVATLLPVVLATALGNALVLLFLPGADGFFVNVTVLWTSIWVAAFFHAMFDTRLWRVVIIQSGLILISALPVFMAITSSAAS